MDSQIVFGPYTPQETDRLALSLQNQQIPFELQKDLEDEKKFTRQDFGNIVTRAEYRTQTYLAQIFYFVIPPDRRGDFEKILSEEGLAPQEKGHEASDVVIEIPAAEERQLLRDASRKKQTKQFVAAVLVIVFLGPIIYMGWSFFKN